MTDQISARHKRRIKALADAMEREALQHLLLDHVEIDGFSFPVPVGTTSADLDAARVMVLRRLREGGQLDLAQRFSAATVETGAKTRTVTLRTREHT